MNALHELSIAEAGALLRSGSLTSVALTEDALARIEAFDGGVHSFITVTDQRALADAAHADEELRCGIDRGPMHGIPYALKDIYDTCGIPTTCNSRLRLDYVPDTDATVVSKLIAGGAVLLGKLATHEFALGGPSFDLPFPPARNPWNLEHFTGGSSSGCGAAVAAGLVRATLGSDTSGSIRGPAALCGVVGVKPTSGLVSRRGVFPLSYTLDQCGPVTWTVDDAALLLQVIAGFDPHDPASVDIPIPDFRVMIGRDLEGVSIAYPRHWVAGSASASPELVARMDEAVQTLVRLGASVEEVTLPEFEVFDACGRTIMIAESYAIHERDLRQRPRDYGRYTYQRMIVGATLTAADLTQAQRLRRELAVTVNRDVFARHHTLVTATSLKPAPRLADFPADWPLTTSMQAIPFSVTGNPALAMPIGFASSGLPLSMQVVGRAFGEPMMFRVAAAFEAATNLPGRRPSLFL